MCVPACLRYTHCNKQVHITACMRVHTEDSVGCHGSGLTASFEISDVDEFWELDPYYLQEMEEVLIAKT